MNWIFGPKKRIKVNIFWNALFADGKGENPIEKIRKHGSFFRPKKDKKLYFFNKIYRKKLKMWKNQNTVLIWMFYTFRVVAFVQKKG